jgi:hypothetical protein
MAVGQPRAGNKGQEQSVGCRAEGREQMLDKTLADSFPASDPPSSIPDPCEEEIPVAVENKAA